MQNVGDVILLNQTGQKVPPGFELLALSVLSGCDNLYTTVLIQMSDSDKFIKNESFPNSNNIWLKILLFCRAIISQYN